MDNKHRKPPEPFTSSPFSLGQALKELYSWYLPPAEQAKFYLIERYWKLLSYRLIKEYNRLDHKRRTEGVKHTNQLFANRIYNRNPFLELAKNRDEFVGKYVPVLLTERGPKSETWKVENIKDYQVVTINIKKKKKRKKS